MPKSVIIQFDAQRNSKEGDRPVRDFMRTFFEHALHAQGSKNEEFQRIYRVYRGQMDMNRRDPNRANIFVPKLHSTIETIVPQYVDALLGVRPYIPIELTKNRNADMGDAITDLLDCYLDTGNFYWEAVKLIKYVTLFGTGFIEALPDYEIKRVERLQPIVASSPFGQPQVVGMEKIVEMKSFLRLVYRAYAPWEIFKDPNAKTLADARGIIKFRGLTSKRQLKKMAERGAFPDFDPDKLDFDLAELDKDDIGKRIAQDLGVSMAKTDDDLGIWLSYESPERYIDFWNLTTVLRDLPNPFAKEHKGHGEINLTRIINTDDPNPYTSFYGIGEGKPVEQLSHAINENWNQTFDNHNMQNQGVIFYDEEALSVDQLVMIAGNRIPVTPARPGVTIRESFFERETPGLNRDHYAIPEKLEQMFDEATGLPGITRGEDISRQQTAREAILKRQAGDARMKLKIKLGEQMGLADFGLKCVHHIDQFATPDDIVEKIGAEKASTLPTVNPGAIDGGYRFAFKGSNRTAESQIKRQDAKDVYQLMAGNTTVDQNWLANWTLERFDVPDQERRQAVRTNEDALKMEEQLAQIAATGKQGEATRAISNGQTLGGNLGFTPSGRDQNEKLSI